MVNGEAGKGDTYRPVNRKAWDDWWDKYERAKKRGLVRVRRVQRRRKRLRRKNV